MTEKVGVIMGVSFAICDPEQHFIPLLQIRTLGMLRSRFESVPGAFCSHLVPSAKDVKGKDMVGKKCWTNSTKWIISSSLDNMFDIQNLWIWFLNYHILRCSCFFFLLKDEATARRNIANFSLVWNQFIDSLRMEDLINNE